MMLPISFSMIGSQTGETQTILDGTIGKRDFEFAPGQPLFVDGEDNPPVLEQRSTGIVPVPDANYVHGATLQFE